MHIGIQKLFEKGEVNFRFDFRSQVECMCKNYIARNSNDFDV